MAEKRSISRYFKDAVIGQDLIRSISPYRAETMGGQALLGLSLAEFFTSSGILVSEAANNFSLHINPYVLLSILSVVGISGAGLKFFPIANRYSKIGKRAREDIPGVAQIYS